MGTNELTDADYELADRIEEALLAHPGSQTPSAIGRWTKDDASAVRSCLAWMVRDRFAECDRDSVYHAWARFALPTHKYRRTQEN